MVAEFDGKVALVTGGSSGIGRASALAFAAAGARVIVADVDDVGGAETVLLIEEAGGVAHYVSTDVRLSAAIERLVAEAVSVFGRLDFAHNNAGIAGRRASTADYDDDEWERIIAINLTGIWRCMKHEVRYMMANGGGAIVNTASVAGLIAAQGMAAYVASKHGVVGLTQTAAREYAPLIRINAVCPGYVRTPMVDQAFGGNAELEARYIRRIPAGRFGTPAEVAATVVWLCSDAAPFVTGHALVIDGGMIV